MMNWKITYITLGILALPLASIPKASAQETAAGARLDQKLAYDEFDSIRPKGPQDTFYIKTRDGYRECSYSASACSIQDLPTCPAGAKGCDKTDQSANKGAKENSKSEEYTRMEACSHDPDPAGCMHRSEQSNTIPGRGNSETTNARDYIETDETMNLDLAPNPHGTVKTKPLVAYNAPPLDLKTFSRSKNTSDPLTGQALPSSKGQTNAYGRPPQRLGEVAPAMMKQLRDSDAPVTPGRWNSDISGFFSRAIQALGLANTSGKSAVKHLTLGKEDSAMVYVDTVFQNNRSNQPRVDYRVKDGDTFGSAVVVTAPDIFWEY